MVKYKSSTLKSGVGLIIKKMKNQLKWRLGKLPTSEEVRNLVKDKIITIEEAKEILFSSESEEDRDKKNLQDEIKFLKELVDKLSDRTKITEIIREVEKPYITKRWFEPYVVYYNSTPSMTQSGTTTTTSGTALVDTISSGISGSNFSNIKTF